ncbi:galactosyltransferase-related protein [Rhizobium sp. SAFR-030]|uniref:galactosyltransferase-related protein n=1 Tax=Rhizobium sp. SAFR-030 TaxID=3387277 RepID=UPI003F7E301A
MVSSLVTQLLDFPEIDRIVLVLNIPEVLDLPQSSRIETLWNMSPRGFGANHNFAFRLCASDCFLVLNPDIVFLNDPFPALFAALQNSGAAVVAPLVTTADGTVEDNVRRFPTISGLLRKAWGLDDGSYRLTPGQADIEPDWIGGMFMLFRADDFREIGGFDEAYFLYYEDVDICARLWRQDRRIVACPAEKVIHNAQRASHRNWRFRRWHLQSALRYLLRYSWRRPRRAAPA